MDTTQRDELAEIIDRPEHHYDTGSHYELSATDAADAILAAGYRKHRTINTIDELAALNRGDVLASSFWADAFSYIGGDATPAELANVATGERVTISEDSDFLPATVVYAFEWANRTPQV